MLQLSKWDPWRPRRDLLENLRTFLQVNTGTLPPCSGWCTPTVHCQLLPSVWHFGRQSMPAITSSAIFSLTILDACPCPVPCSLQAENALHIPAAGSSMT